MPASAAAVGSEPPSFRWISTKTPAATASAAVIVVTRTKLNRLRPRRLTAARLRCCDNAVLPSAKHAGRNAQYADRCGTGQQSSDGSGQCGATRLAMAEPPHVGPAPSPHYVARSEGADQALPLKKLCCKRGNCVPQITVWQ